jgi:hypothetical protein
MIVNDLSNELASKINAAHDLFQKAGLTALERARDCGELLIEARKQIERGKWLAWLKANIRCSPRTCQYYVKVAENWEALSSQYATVASITLRQAIKLLAPAKPSPNASPEEYLSTGRHQALLAFYKEAVTRPKWKSRYEAAINATKKADELDQQVSELRAKACKARRRAERLKLDLHDALKREFNAISPLQIGTEITSR